MVPGERQVAAPPPTHCDNQLVESFWPVICVLHQWHYSLQFLVMFLTFQINTGYTLVSRIFLKNPNILHSTSENRIFSKIHDFSLANSIIPSAIHRWSITVRPSMRSEQSKGTGHLNWWELCATEMPAMDERSAGHWSKCGNGVWNVSDSSTWN